jgi:hypothetical protein
MAEAAVVLPTLPQVVVKKQIAFRVGFAGDDVLQRLSDAQRVK